MTASPWLFRQVQAHQVNPADADWLVPGLLRGKKLRRCSKRCPKVYRRQLVPVSDTADMIAKEMPRTRDDLATALGNFIHRRFKVDIPATAWQENALPAHLKMRFTVAGPDGEAVRDRSGCGDTPKGRAGTVPGNRSGQDASALGTGRHHRLGFRRSTRKHYDG